MVLNVRRVPVGTTVVCGVVAIGRVAPVRGVQVAVVGCPAGAVGQDIARHSHRREDQRKIGISLAGMCSKMQSYVVAQYSGWTCIRSFSFELGLQSWTTFRGGGEGVRRGLCLVIIAGSTILIGA